MAKAAKAGITKDETAENRGKGRGKRPSAPNLAQDQAAVLALQNVTSIQAVNGLLQSHPGQPLPPPVRETMESRFGHDLNAVRVHTGTEADKSAEQVQARAYTVGDDIVFKAGQYNLQSRSGGWLLAHELAHVVQQSRGGPTPPLTPAAVHERDATAAATAVVNGQTQASVQTATGIGLARDEGDKPMTAAHAGGEMGERDAAFALGRKGFSYRHWPRRFRRA